MNFLQGDGAQTNSIYLIALYAIGIAAFYFFLIRPQSKKKKAETELRKSLEIGDELTTIGGIVGRVVNIKEDLDSIVIETSIDRTKVMIKRWAISNIDTIKDEPKK